MMSIDFKKSFLAVLTATALTACGGGGGGGGGDGGDGGDDGGDGGSKLSPKFSSTCIKMNGTTEQIAGTCFDWDSADTLNYFKELASRMTREYGIDAWRFDQAYQVPIGKWKEISASIKDAASANQSDIAGFNVAEVWDGDGKEIQNDALKGAALESAFNFPLRFKLVQTIAGQEDESDYGYIRQPASGLADEWGYGNYIRYDSTNVMPTMFIDNHDLVRLGNLLFRWGFVSEANVGSTNYQLRHLLGFAFMGAYSGPITIYYGSEYGDYTKGFSTKLSPCGKDDVWCDDHVSRTQMVSSESELSDWQKKLRSNSAKIITFRNKTPAMYNGARYHIYSTESAPSDNNAANFYVDVKKAGEKAYVFVMSTSGINRSLRFTTDVSNYLCQKAVGSNACSLKLVMNTAAEDVTNPAGETIGGDFVFNMPALSAKYYEVSTADAAPVDAVFTDVTATAVSSLAEKYDDKINAFTCFKGENPKKCGLVIYQVMVEAAPAGSDANGKGYGWGPSEHKGTLGGIEQSLDFIKGVGANALWITPVFTTNNSGDTAQRNTDATGYFASSHWQGDKATIDPDFGGENSLRSLIDTVHSKGMYFILDGVFGHAKSDMSSDSTYINIE